MGACNPYILTGLLAMILITALMSLLVYKKGVSNIFLLNLSLLSIVIIWELFNTVFHIVSTAASYGMLVLFFVNPVVYCLIIKAHYQFVRDKYLVSVMSFSLVTFLAGLIYPLFAAKALAINSFFAYEFIGLSALANGNRNANRFFKAAHILFGLLQLVTIITDRPIYSLYINTLASIWLFAFMEYMHKKKITGILEQCNSISEQNKKLTHTISRLKISNDQCKKILIDKDLELYQLARHASLAELTTGIAHELSQPLTGIKLIAQNIIDDINFDEFDNMQAVSELVKISSLVDKSSTIINHIRNFSKKAVSIMKIIDLNTVILDAIELINLQMKKNNIELVFLFDDTIPSINADKIALEQLFINIVLNAKDAILKKKDSKPDHEGSIHITTSSSDGFVKIIIEDNGIGIPENMVQKIWSPFYTTKKRDHGTGVGLSISHKILKDHNGKVEVQSSPTGTVFTFFFPVPDADSESTNAIV